MSSSSHDRSADSLFDSFDTPPRPPHASGSRSSAAVVPPAPSRAGYGRVMPSRSTAATGTRTNRRRNRDDASPARSSSSSSSSTRSWFNVDPSSNLTPQHDPSTTVSTGSQLSSPPAGYHYTTGHDPHRDTFQDNDDDHEEESRSFRDVPDETTSRSGSDDQDNDNDGAESEESESELSILHKIGLIPPPSTLPQGNRSGRHRFKVNEGDDGVDEGVGLDGVDEGYRTSWMGPSEVKGMRMGPRLTDRGVGFEGVGESCYPILETSRMILKDGWYADPFPSDPSFVGLNLGSQTIRPIERSSTINLFPPHSSLPLDPTSIDYERPHPTRPTHPF